MFFAIAAAASDTIPPMPAASYTPMPPLLSLIYAVRAADAAIYACQLMLPPCRALRLLLLLL